MAYTTVNKSTANFNTKLWAGNGSSQAFNRCWSSNRYGLD